MFVSSSPLFVEATIHEKSGVPSLAKVLLRDKKGNAGKTIQTSGKMSSFKLVEGDIKKLREFWWGHAVIWLRVNDEDKPVKVSAMPLEQGGEGYVEFL